MYLSQPWRNWDEYMQCLNWPIESLRYETFSFKNVVLVVLAFRSGRKSYCILLCIALWEPYLGFVYEIYEALTIFSFYNKASTSHIWPVSSKHAKSNRRTEKAGAILGLAIFHLWCPSWGMRNFEHYWKRKKNIHYFHINHNTHCFPPKFLHKYCFQVLLGGL